MGTGSIFNKGSGKTIEEMMREEELRKQEESIRQLLEAEKQSELEKQREERRRMTAMAFNKKRGEVQNLS